jgi:hypothetical protein
MAQRLSTANNIVKYNATQEAMSYQINFVPLLTLNNNNITLSGIKDKLGNFRGYEFNPEKDSANAVELGKLSDLSHELCTLAELDSDAFSANSITNLLPKTLGDKVSELSSSITDAKVKLLHFKIDTSSNEKEVTITGEVTNFNIYSLSAKGFSLEITSGPDGIIDAIDVDKKKITVAISQRGMNAINSAVTRYIMKGSKDSSTLEVTLDNKNESSATFAYTGNTSLVKNDSVELTQNKAQATPVN